MATQQDRTDQTTGGRTVIAVDAMGGDRGAAVVVAGMARSAKKNPDISFIVHGNEAELTRLMHRRPKLRERTKICPAEKVIPMTEKPSKALRNGKGSSMWGTLESVANGEASVAISCGNTGALMAISMLQLRKLPNVSRPAIAIYWPSRNPAGYNVLLDAGADIKADAQDLLQYAVMGASYARNGLKLKKPRIGLLNVGTEEHKGRSELQDAAALIAETADSSDFEFVGFVEGNDLPTTKVDVVVTDGFTGNVALKTAEGTASLVRELLKKAFSFSPLSRIGALFALTSLRRLQKRIDPRRVNGGVFLGLNGTVIKSHGSADATGVSAAIKLAFVLAQNGFSEKLARRVASGGTEADNTVQSDSSGAKQE